MKTKKRFSKILILLLVFTLGMRMIPSLAFTDVTNGKDLRIEYFRYVNGAYKNGYALNTTGNEGESHHPVFQILSSANGTNYYCLNATAGETWMNSTVGKSTTYNRKYDLNLASDIESLKSDTSISSTYSNIGKSQYLTQILWILDNMYVPTSGQDNTTKKNELLAKAGIRSDYGLDMYDLNGKQYKGYRYVKVDGYDYSKFVSDQGKQGYMYFDTNENQVNVVLPDELIETVQQAAIWYFTNYKDNNSANSGTYNAYLNPESETIINWLNWSNGTTETNTNKWKSLANYTVECDGEDAEGNQLKAEVGKWYQEQATILYDYLVDAANNYASTTGATSNTGSPLTITPETTGIEKKTISSTEYYVVGPITINEKRPVVYDLDDTITVNGSTSTGAYISDSNGNKKTSQKVSNYIGTEFYVTVPASKITENTVKINFTGTYKTNEKTLWISTTKTEQPVVEVTPKSEEIKLEVTATKEDEKTFDLALRKRITKLTNSSGTAKSIVNESSKDATRSSSIAATDIADIATNKTATYKHRKDPIVVEKGDVVTYSITIYNEGEKAGYASTIVDKLPQGLALKGYTASSTTTGTYSKGDIKYTYVYNPSTNEITFTNVNKKDLAAYTGGTTLASETIEIECEVIKEPSTTTNTYLTNIAYITKEHNSVDNKDITNQDGEDRDSKPLTYPTATQETTGTTYNGYKGNNDNQSVYNDTNNGYYYKGQEDDDDFEVVVIKPTEFDLALQKYISKIMSQDGTLTNQGRQEPKINTSSLNKIVDSKKVTTAKYTQDKTPIQVEHGDYVTYTFTVYNEGDADGYVNKITDNIPKGLQFVYAKNNDGKTVIVCDSEGNFEEMEVSESVYNAVTENNSYWTIDSNNGAVKKDTYNGETTVSVTCDVEQYLGTKKLLKAYDSSKDVNNNGAGLDRISVTLILRVKAENKEKVLIRNEAAITEAEDTNGNKQDISELKDRDSQVNQWKGKDTNDYSKYQDDEDYDNIILEDLEIHKGVKTVENQDSGYNKDEEHTWKISSDISSDIANYKKYEITDDIDYRLNFGGIDKVVVKIGETTLEKDKDYTIIYTENENGVKDKTTSGTLKLVFINNEAGKNVTENLTKNAGGKIDITFKTTFATDAQGNLLAKLGEEVENQAKLDYKNSSNTSKEKKTEKPEVHTGGVTLYKYSTENGTKNPIKDAEFSIYKTEADAKSKKNAISTETSGDDGIVRFKGLEYGEDASDKEENKTESGTYEYDSTKQSTKYYIAETKAPDGYVSLENIIEVTINSTSYEEDSKKITYQVPNTPITGKYDVILIKEDENGEQLNSKATFEVNGESKDVTGKLTIAKDVKIDKTNVNTPDVYTIKETKAPDEYCEFGGIITITVNKKLADDGKSYVIDSKNYKVEDSEGNDITNIKDVDVYLKDGNIYVEVKNYKGPEIHKGVKTVENQDSGYNKDEEHTWAIRSDIPIGIENYKKYEITDDIDYRLSFSGIDKVQVKIGEKTLVKDTDYKITYTENKNGVTDKTTSGTWKIVFINEQDGKKVTENLTKNAGGKIDITFKTTFATDVQGKILAKLGEEIENQAKLDYTNSSNISKEKKTERPEVHTGGVTLYKYYTENETKNPLKGAEFTIYKTEADAKAKKNAIYTETSGEDGIVRFTGLEYGEDASDKEENKTSSGTYEYDSTKQSTKYYVAETKEPEGYLLSENIIEVTINSTSYEEDSKKIDYQVPNTPIKGKYDVILIKEDQNGEDLKSEAIFEVNGETKQVTGRLTVAKDVEINKSNLTTADVYTIKETKAPDKYCEFDGTITITVNKKLAEDGKLYVIDKIDYKVIDSKGNDITDTKDAKVYLKDGNLYVEVIDYEKEFDLKLMKFIAEVNSKKTDRNITVDASNLGKIVNNKKVTTANYNVSKEPIGVKTGDYVTYTFRIYNEGELDGYAKEITEDIPEGLKFVTEQDPNLTEKDKAAIEFNKGFSWNVATKDSSGSAKTISTDYLSRAKGESNLLKAFNSETMDTPDSKDVSVMLKVISKDTKNIIRNEAEISDDEDEDGNSVNDRDSKPEEWKKEDSDDYYDGNKDYPKYKEDDEDYDNIIIKKVDLALTKFIVAISDDMIFEDGEYLTKDTTSKNAGSKENPYTRQTAVDTTPLKEGTANDAIYTRVKTPITVPEESYVLYNIRVYNEGEVDVYAGEVADYLPNYLDFVSSEFNDNFGWKVGTDGKTVKTSYLSHTNGTDKILKAFDKENDDGAGSKLDYKDLQILTRVNSKAPDATKLINTAEITKYEDEDGNDLEEDIDSKPENVPEKNKEQRVEDDDDWEVVEVTKKKVDLALSKFIAAISDDTEIVDGEYLTPNGKVGSKENPYTRATSVNTKELRDNPECHDATYTKVKDPLVVPAKSYVLYDIRVYNEGETDVYAGEVTDHLPEYLDFVSCEFNDSFGWKVESDGKTIKTTYLSYEKGQKNLLKAFDKKTDDGAGSGLDYRDLQVLCKVSDTAPSNTQIINIAEITKYEDKDGKDIPEDIDSTPNNVEKKNEDDDDYEVVLIKTFDLSLLKWVSTVYVTEDGKTKTTQTGNTGNDNTDIIPKVEINRKKINSTVVKFGYTIKITNEGDIDGFAKEITDYVPQGLKFYKEDNNGWEEKENGVITTRLLENTLLQPGESASVTVVFRWINGATNLGLKTNIAEISEDYNKEGIPDRDSTPGNKVWGEDDIDDAQVLLSISTGLVENIIMYAIGATIILVVLAGGIVGIKKFVL